MRALTLGLALAVLTARARGQDGGTTIDRVEASLELEGDVVPRFALHSEYVLLLRTELLSRGAPDALTTRVDPTVSDAVLEQLMAEQLVVREAERAGEGDPGAEALLQARTGLVRLLGGDARLRSLEAATGATDNEFDALVRRRVVTERYLVAHAPRLIEPADTDLRQAYESERFRAYREGGMTFAAARRPIRDELVRAGLPSSARLYLRSLGSRVRVRNFHDGSAEGAGHGS